MVWKDWLPDLKGALNSFYDESLKDALESKSKEYKELLNNHLNRWNDTQRVLILIALGIFLLILIAHFWPNN